MITRITNKKLAIWTGVLILLLIGTFFFICSTLTSIGEIMVLSVSSNGNYVISTSLQRKAILWDLRNHTYRVLDKQANIYSAYFVKNSSNYMWQHDPDNEVYIKNISGREIKRFNSGFPTYGQVITTDLENYFGSNEDWSVWRIRKGEKLLLKKGDGGFLGVGKLFNMTLTDDNTVLLFSGIGSDCDDYKNCLAIRPKDNLPVKPYDLEGVVLWNLNTAKPIWDFPGNVAKTIATISPDGKYVVSGDEQLSGDGYDLPSKLVYSTF